MEKIHLTVSGMTCVNCVKHVEKAIHLIVGVRKVEVDLASGAVKVEGNVSQHLKEITAALEEDGYPAKISSDASPQAMAKSGSCKSGTSCCCN